MSDEGQNESVQLRLRVFRMDVLSGEVRLLYSVKRGLRDLNNGKCDKEISVQDVH